MYICYSWLKDLCKLDVDLNDFLDKITMTGTKVETVKYFGEKIRNIVTGKILEIRKHQDADKLVVMKVDIGDKILQIITGAKNVFEGAIVPVAMHNAVLADGTKIKKSKIRGELSEGMLCSIQELGHNKSQYPEAPEDGIYIFRDNTEIGKDACEILELKDIAIDFEITSNRPDCLSVYGVAREATATFEGSELNELELEGLDIGKNDFDFEIKGKNLCKRYMAQEIKNVEIEASPQWLRHRLIISGINPVNNIVDITNYVMLETGQPLHAFDADKIKNKKIIVRKSFAGETIKTLDGVDRKLDNDILLIADEEKILALAGIMGGEKCKVDSDTKNILLESANFDGYNIRLSSKKLNLRTDASARYEKEIDFNLAEFAMRRAIYLIKKLGAGEIKNKTFDFCPSEKNIFRKIDFNAEKINKLLGLNILKEDMVNILQKLGFEIKDNFIYVPSFRNDIECDADIAEEVLRFYGYDKLNLCLPKNNNIGGKNENSILDDRIKSILVAQGAYEIKNFAFASYSDCKKFYYDEDNKNLDEKIIKIINPLGEEFAFMRNNLFADMIKNLVLNFNKKNQARVLFELGKVYELNDSKDVINEIIANEKKMLCIGFYGEKDFFDLKGIIENLFYELKIYDFDFDSGSIDFLHRYRQAKIFVDKKYVGYLGQYCNEKCEIKAEVYLAVLDLTYIYERESKRVKFKELNKFPEMERDLSLLVDKNISAKEVYNIIFDFKKNNQINILKTVKLFDVYEGENLGAGIKSMGYKLIFGANDRTLREEEVNLVMGNMVKFLKEKHNISLRV